MESWQSGNAPDSKSGEPANTGAQVQILYSPYIFKGFDDHLMWLSNLFLFLILSRVDVGMKLSKKCGKSTCPNRICKLTTLFIHVFQFDNDYFSIWISSSRGEMRSAAMVAT